MSTVGYRFGLPVFAAWQCVHSGVATGSFGFTVSVPSAWLASGPWHDSQAMLLCRAFARRSTTSTWHSAQHARQMIAVLERLGLEPDVRLTSEDLAGLPLPERIWE